MKLLMTTDTLGGVWTYALQLADALQPHGVEIALATQGAPLTDDQRADAEELDNVQLHESGYRLEWMDDPWDDVAAAGEWLLELAATVSPDVVHLNDYSHGALPWGVPVVVVGHSCVCSWFRAVREADAGPEWNRYRAAVRNGLQSADRVVTPTQTMLDWLNEFYGPLPPTQVIFNGRDPWRMLPASARTLAASATAAHTRKDNLVFTAGRLWDEAKNVAAVARIADRLKWPVHAAGIPHPERDDATPDGLHFLGRLTKDGMADAYARASIYVLPARYEPFGLTPLEAALAGCALVLGEIPTLREIWGPAAMFVPPDHDERLAAAVNALIDDSRLREHYRLAAWNRAQRLNAAAMADGYLELYRELVAESESSRIVLGGRA